MTLHYFGYAQTILSKNLKKSSFQSHLTVQADINKYFCKKILKNILFEKTMKCSSCGNHKTI